MALPLDRLVDAGVSIWLDDLSRVRLAEGGLDRLIRDRHVTGVTTNPTIFAKAISGGDAYDAHIEQLALRQVGADTALRERRRAIQVAESHPGGGEPVERG